MKRIKLQLSVALITLSVSLSKVREDILAMDIGSIFIERVSIDVRELINKHKLFLRL